MFTLSELIAMTDREKELAIRLTDAAKYARTMRGYAEQGGDTLGVDNAEALLGILGATVEGEDAFHRGEY